MEPARSAESPARDSTDIVNLLVFLGFLVPFALNRSC